MEIKEDSVHFIRMALTKIADDADKDAEEERIRRNFPAAYSLEGVARRLRDVLVAVPTLPAE
jgi:hypothetical protein